MESIDDKVDILLGEINKLPQVKKIKELNKEISNDINLKELIEKYKCTMSEEVKSIIVHNSLFREYKTNEVEINLLIMDINSRLKNINRKKGCRWK